MQNSGKMLVFDNPNDFLEFMDYLQEEYNKAHETKEDNRDGNDE